MSAAFSICSRGIGQHEVSCVGSEVRAAKAQGMVALDCFYFPTPTLNHHLILA